MKYLRLKPGRFIQRLCSTLILEERITIASAAALNLLVLASLKIRLAWDIFGLNILIILVIFGVASFHRHVGRTWMQFFRDWYVPIFLFVIFLENRRLVPLINPHDQDTLLIGIKQNVAACHNGYFSCFYRELKDGAWEVVEQRVFDPDDAYGR